VKLKHRDSFIFIISDDDYDDNNGNNNNNNNNMDLKARNIW
jgi:hypothetical protein